jgi:hypothetical protein
MGGRSTIEEKLQQEEREMLKGGKRMSPGSTEDGKAKLLNIRRAILHPHQKLQKLNLDIFY